MCSQLKLHSLLCHLFLQSRIWHHRTALHQQGPSTQPPPPVDLGAYSNFYTKYACLAQKPSRPHPHGPEPARAAPR